MNQFTLPKEFNDFISSASDLLSQYKQHSNHSFQDFLVFRIFLDEPTGSLDSMLALRHQVVNIISPLQKGYMWHKDNLRVKVIIPEDKSPMFLGGVLEFGDCVDDEWFVVSLLYEVSKQLSHISISITDTDGQFLLIEASSADLPDWIGPENSENRVWIKSGQLHIIPIDEAGRRRSGGIDVPSALSILASTSDNTNASVSSSLASRTIQQVIQSRIITSHAKNQAQLHHAAVTVPLKVAQLLTARPSIISAAVSGLCSTHERTKHTNKVISSMSYFGTSPLVTISATFTRALYAQLTFQERFHPPPKFLNAQRVLQAHQQREMEEGQTKGEVWDAAASKAFDVGCRISCGLEIAYQSALGEEKQWSEGREKRKGTVCSHLKDSFGSEGVGDIITPTQVVVSVPSSDLSSETILSTGMTDETSTSSSTATAGIEVMNCFRPLLSLSEKINLALQEPQVPLSPRAENSTSARGLHAPPPQDEEELSFGDHCAGNIQDIVISEVSPSTCDSDTWLYMTPEEFDANMQSRIDATTSVSPVKTADITSQSVSNLGVPSETDFVGSDDSDDDADGTDLWKNHAPSPAKRGVVDEETENVNALASIVSGMDSFMASYSDYSGVSKEKNGDESVDTDDDEDDEQDESETDSDDEDNQDRRLDDSTVAPVGDNSSEGPIIEAIDFDSTKLMSILAAQGLSPSESGLILGENDGGCKDNEDVEDIKFNEMSLVDDGENLSIKSKKSNEETRVKVKLSDADDGDDDRDSFYDSSSDDSDDYDSDENKEVSDAPREDSDDENNVDETGEDYMEAYQAILDHELSGSTLVETFEKFDSDEGGATGGVLSASLQDVDIEKNLLKNFLESHAGQMNSTGPASNLLSQMGLSLPRPPRMNEETPSEMNHIAHVENDQDDETVDSDDEVEGSQKSSYMNPASQYKNSTDSNYFLNNSSLD